jgi:hypothetical protein
VSVYLSAVLVYLSAVLVYLFAVLVYLLPIVVYLFAVLVYLSPIGSYLSPTGSYLLTAQKQGAHAGAPALRLPGSFLREKLMRNINFSTYGMACFSGVCGGTHPFGQMRWSVRNAGLPSGGHKAFPLFRPHSLPAGTGHRALRAVFYRQGLFWTRRRRCLMDILG